MPETCKPVAVKVRRGLYELRGVTHTAPRAWDGHAQCGKTCRMLEQERAACDWRET